MADDPKQTTDAKFASLKRSPIFAMSHGGLELFHSNVWAWLIEHDPRYAKVFFPKLKGQSVSVKREQSVKSKNEQSGKSKREQIRLDLTIWVDSKTEDLFVVENKTKTLPSEAQLKQYSKAIEEDGKTLRDGIIVGIVEPAWSVDGWRWLDLNEIAKRILNIAKKEPDDRIKAIVQEYGKTTKAMCDLLDVKDLKNRLPDPKETGKNKELDDLHLRDIYFKLGANLFVRKFRESSKFQSLWKRFKKLGLDIRVDDGFTDKKWCIDIKIFKEENSKAFDESKGNPSVAFGDPFITFGIQIQGDQFRRMAEVFHATPSNQFDAIFNHFQNLEWFDAGVGTAGWREKDETHQRKPSNKTKAYGKFTPLFVYQYIDLKDFSHVPVSNAICEHLEKALSLAKNHPDIFDLGLVH